MEAYKTFIISGIFVIMLCLMTIPETNAQLPPNDAAYELVFSDDFDGTQLDTSKWFKSYPWHQNSNKKIFCNLPDSVNMANINVDFNDTLNCKVGGGTLKLITRKENSVGSCWTWPSCINDWDPQCNGNHICVDGHCWNIQNKSFNFTTAMLFSKNTFRYGYYEIRFKLPPLPVPPKTNQGHGATFWLHSGEPFWSEIDIFEVNANNNYCFAAGNRYWRDGNDSATLYPETWGENWEENIHCFFSPDTWHTAALNWTSSAMEYYYDGELQWVSRNCPDSICPMSIIVNNGGNYVPVDNYCIPFDTEGADSTHFPYTYEIDYIKVWQLKKDCSTDVSLTTFNPLTYSNMLHKSVTTGTSVSITNQTFQTFWGTDYVLINEGTTVDDNSTVLFNATNCVNITKTITSAVTPPPLSFIYRLLGH